jgi:hypothetical protein
MGTIILFRRQQPLPERLTMLNMDKCLRPCWIGIVPGQTTLDEAEHYIRAAYAEPLYKITAQIGTVAYTIQRQSTPKETFTIWLTAYPGEKSGVIHVIALYIEQTITAGFYWDNNPTATRIYAGDVMTLMGFPGVVLANRKTRFGHTVAYKYGSFYTVQEFPASLNAHGQLLPTQPVTSMWFANGNHNPFASFNQRPWHGFSTLREHQ